MPVWHGCPGECRGPDGLSDLGGLTVDQVGDISTIRMNIVRDIHIDLAVNKQETTKLPSRRSGAHETAHAKLPKFQTSEVDNLTASQQPYQRAPHQSHR